MRASWPRIASSTSRAAPESMASSALRVPCSIVSAKPPTYIAAPAFSAVRSRSGPASPASTARAISALRSGVPAASADWGETARPTSSGFSVQLSRCPSARSSTMCVGPEVLSSSRPSSEATSSACSQPSSPSAPAMMSRKRRSDDADQLAAGPGRVGQRAQEVEDRAHGQALAHRHHVLHGRVVAGGEHEAEADLLDARGHLLRRQVDARAQRLEHVGRARAPGGRAVAVLGHRHPRPGGHERRGGGHVEGGPPAAGAGGVHQARAVGGHGHGQVAHGARHAGQLADGLALGPERDQQRGGLDLGGAALHDLVQHGRGLVHGQGLAAAETVDRLGEYGVGGVAHCRKLRSMAMPCSVSTDSGWNCTPSAGSSRWRRAMIVSP